VVPNIYHRLVQARTKTRLHYVTRHNEFVSDYVGTPKEDGNSAPIILEIYLRRVNDQNF
jgi:hypothetical protein